MYEALISGIKLVGEDKFSWKTTNQQKVWQKEEFKQIIASFEDAENAVKTISLQGEGTTANKDKFMIPSNYCLEDENDDPHDLNEYSHYERLLKIKNQGVPDVYPVVNNGQNKQEQQEALQELQDSFAKLLGGMNKIWNEGEEMSDNNFWNVMTAELIPSLESCWQNGVIPKWSSKKTQSFNFKLNS